MLSKVSNEHPHEPEMKGKAKQWADETPSPKDLPKHVKTSKRSFTFTKKSKRK